MQFRTLRGLLFIFFAILCSQQVAEGGTLTLEACLKQAMEHNPLLQTVRWDNQVAEQQLQLANSQLYPRLDIQGGYTAQLEPQAIKAEGRMMETQQGEYGFATLSATYTIYDFGRRDARVEQARSAQKAVGKRIRQYEQDMALQVIQTYFAVLEAEKLISTTEQELDTVNEHRRVAQALYDNGMVTRNDLLQADLQNASSRQRLLGAQNLARNMRLKLNYLIGATADENRKLEEPPQPVPDQLQGEQDDSDALLDRPDIQLLQQQIRVGESELLESKNIFSPELFARGTADYLQNDKVREQTIFAATIGIKLNIFDGFGSSAARGKAISNLSRLQQQMAMARMEARLEISTARNDLAVAYQQIAVNEKAIKQGEENLRINQNRYQERVGTATELLDAQSMLSRARTEYYQSYYQYQIAAARLARALGRL